MILLKLTLNKKFNILLLLILYSVPKIEMNMQYNIIIIIKRNSLIFIK